MGSGASTEAKSSSKSTAASTTNSSTTVKDVTRDSSKKNNGSTKKTSKEDKFQTACMQVFQKFDKDGNGVLDHDELLAVLSSNDLGLNLSQEELEQTRFKVETTDSVKSEGGVSYAAFIPVMRELLKTIYESKKDDWNDWCRMKDISKGNKVFYLNKRTGATQDEKPSNFNESRKEERSFECITLDNGAELTTYVDDVGVRQYMDWDSQEWKKFPEEWYPESMSKKPKKSLVGTNPADSFEDPDKEKVEDHRAGTYLHPKGKIYNTYLFENERVTRLYYDDTLSTWARMPLSWERNMDEVKSVLKAIDARYPKWGDVNTQLLALHDCNYDLEETLMYAELNFKSALQGTQKEIVYVDRVVEKVVTNAKPSKSIKVTESSTDDAPPGLAVSKSSSGFLDVGNNAPNRRASNIMVGSEAEKDNKPDLGALSLRASEHVENLEKQIVSLTAKLEDAESKLSVSNEELTRLQEKEKRALAADGSMAAQAAAKDEERIQGIQAQLKEALAKVKAQDQQLVKMAAAIEQVAKLEKALKASEDTAAKAGGGSKKSEEMLAAKNEELKESADALLKAKIELAKSQADMAQAASVVKKFPSIIAQIKAVKKSFSEFKVATKDQFLTFGGAVKDFKKGQADLNVSLQFQIDDYSKKYRAEMLQRKILYNKVQELKGNIRVFIRCRSDDRAPCVMEFPSDTELLIPSLKGEKMLMDFDRVYNQQANQKDIFTDTEALILSVTDGYNVCIMAYGQTGSGKTYTMMGTPDNPGVNRRAIQRLFQLTSEKKEMKFSLKCAMMEVYNENLYDLLVSERTPLNIRQNPNKTVYAENLTEREIREPEDVTKVIAEADSNRSVACTKMNSTSSRSHCIIQIFVESYNSISKVTTKGTLRLVDLAGSERVAKTDCSGDRLVEAAAINKSLSSLGQVFSAIGSNQTHIPYRNSKLTHILQDSLGGDSKTAMFLALSPNVDNLSETHSTLLFGKGIRCIELGPAKKNNAPPPPK